MRIDLALFVLSLFGPMAVGAVAAPEADVAHIQPVQQRDHSQQGEELWKRKGGGGGGGRGGGGGGSSGSSGGGRSGGSGSGSSGSSGSGGRTGSSGSGGSGSGGAGGGAGSGRGGRNDNSGGQTRGGSGAPPSYGGGRYYGGGAAVPYKAGNRSPLGIAPVFLGIGLLSFWPGLWLYGAYTYPYHHPYSYYNQSSLQNETKPILCGCDPYMPCGCDDNNDTSYLASVIGTGAYNQLNQSLVNVADYQGNSTILINGTLPNGTTAAGGSDELDNAADGLSGLLQAAGLWPVVAAVCAAVFLA